MKKAFALVVLMMLVGCDKKEAAPTASTAAAKPAASAAPAATSAAAAPSAAPSAAPAPSASAEKAEAEEDEQEGLEKGEVVVGYLQDLKDEGQCALLPVKEAEKDKWDAKKIEELAGKMKAKAVPKCPTADVQGTCKSMGMLINYYAPKHTPESAQKHCKQNRGKWFD
ncbi:MAG: hypothetical protein IT375_28740 [Polyangiaceae bacterium]|nr:hypothetical protein [Polyangiaceae bacterium]MCK6536487.1 hypothetical protein [Polyangiaceae bacterium]